MPRIAKERTPEEQAALDQEKRKRWLREGSRRTQAAIKAIDRLSKCANKSLYTYEESEVEAALNAIREQFTTTVNAFNSRSGNEQQGFLLPNATPADVAPRKREEKPAQKK